MSFSTAYDVRPVVKQRTDSIRQLRVSQASGNDEKEDINAESNSITTEKQSSLLTIIAPNSDKDYDEEDEDILEFSKRGLSPHLASNRKRISSSPPHDDAPSIKRQKGREGLGTIKVEDSNETSGITAAARLKRGRGGLTRGKAITPTCGNTSENDFMDVDFEDAVHDAATSSTAPQNRFNTTRRQKPDAAVSISVSKQSADLFSPTSDDDELAANENEQDRRHIRPFQREENQYSYAENENGKQPECELFKSHRNAFTSNRLLDYETRVSECVAFIQLWYLHLNRFCISVKPTRQFTNQGLKPSSKSLPKPKRKAVPKTSSSSTKISSLLAQMISFTWMGTIDNPWMVRSNS